ncbi:hypothetical protein ACJX0J_030349, partial [Zea mays]
VMAIDIDKEHNVRYIHTHTTRSIHTIRSMLREYDDQFDEELYLSFWFEGTTKLGPRLMHPIGVTKEIKPNDWLQVAS